MTNNEIGYRQREELPASALEIEKAQSVIRYVVQRSVTEFTPWIIADGIITKTVDEYIKGIKDPELRAKARQGLLKYATVQYRRLQDQLKRVDFSVLAAVVAVKNTKQGAATQQADKVIEMAVKRSVERGENVYVETEQPKQMYMRDYMRQVEDAYKELAQSEAKDSYSDRVSLRNVAEMTERYNKKQDEITDLMERGIDLVWISTHANCSERCQKWQGKLYSVSGQTGTIDGVSFQPLRNATDIPYTTKAGKTYMNGCITGFNCRHTLTPYRKGNKPIEVSAATVAKYREINDTQRAYERAIREKKALSIGLKSISKKDAKAYAIEARKTFDEYVRYSQKNKVAYYPDRCKVFDGEELISPKYKRILDLYRK